MGWFRKTKSAGEIGMDGKQLNVNPNPNMSLERARGRLHRLKLSIAKRSEGDPKKARMQGTKKRMEALIFYLTDDEGKIKENV